MRVRAASARLVCSCLALSCLLVAFFAPSTAVGAQLGGLQPPSIRTGTTVVRFTVSGVDLDAVSDLRFEPDGIAVVGFELASADGRAITLLASLPALARTGVFDLVATTPAGELRLDDALRVEPGAYEIFAHDPGSEPGTSAENAALALASILLPIALGIVLGVGLRRLRVPWWAVLVFATACAVAGAYGSFRLPDFATWDLLVGVVAIAAGVLVGRASRKTQLGLVASSLILLGTFEIGARVILPAPPQVVSLSLETKLHVARSGANARCQLLYPQLGREWDERFGRVASLEAPAVLHLGDSMVEGLVESRARTSFVSFIDAEDPRRTHVNAGVAGSATDFQWLLLQRLLAERAWDAVVIYLYDNDIHELDTPYRCSGDASLLAWDGDHPRLRLDAPRVDLGPRGLLLDSPPPFALRWAAQWSEGARQLVYAQARAIAAARRGMVSDDWAARWRRFDQLVADMVTRVRATGARPYVVVLPRRFDLEEQRAEGRVEPSLTHRRMLEAVRAAGVEPLDPREVLLAVLDQPPPDLWFGAEEGHVDEHYGRGGHRIVAAWLGPLLGGTEAATPQDQAE